MAAFRKTKGARGVSWQAIVRKRGHMLTRTFRWSEDARAWARDVESAITNASPFKPFDREEWLQVQAPAAFGMTAEVLAQEHDRQAAESTEPNVRWTVGKALDHYDSTVTESHKGWRGMRSKINVLSRLDLAQKRLDELTADDVAALVSDRLKGRGFRRPVQASTVRGDVSRISALYKLAVLPVRKRGWGLTGLVNPCADVLLPKLPPPRENRLDTRGGGEEQAFFAALAAGLDGPQMVAVVALALDTAMRRSEILGLTAEEYRETAEGPEIRKLRTKNGKARTIVLTERAAATISALVAVRPKGKLFTLDGDAVATRWDVAREKAARPDFNFHDLRHEAISRLAEAGFTLPEVMAQSGHSSVASVARYMHARPSEIRRKMSKAIEAGGREASPVIDAKVEDSH